MPLTVENLSYTYNAGLPSERAALSGVSFECGEGQIVSVLGHTGSGKSTLAQHLNGLIAPQSGRVGADGDETGRSAAETRRVRRKVGLVFQYPEEQIFSDKVFDEIAFAPRNWGVPEPEIPARVREAAREAGLDQSLLDASPYGLSGGQKRSVAIASVIAARPSYLVLDEPAAGLDCDAAEALLSMIKNFAASGAGVVLITHDIELAPHALHIGNEMLSVIARGAEQVEQVAKPIGGSGALHEPRIPRHDEFVVFKHVRTPYGCPPAIQLRVFFGGSAASYLIFQCVDHNIGKMTLEPRFLGALFIELFFDELERHEAVAFSIFARDAGLHITAIVIEAVGHKRKGV